MSDVRLRGFLERVRVDEALKRFFSTVALDKPRAEEVGIDNGLGRILAEDVYALYDVPPFDRSAMDGYAVRSIDTVGASVTNSIVMKIVGVSETGHQTQVTLGRFDAVRISTGAPLPEGADAVVMLEYTHELGQDKIEIYRSVTPYENVSRRGEDIKKGSKVLGRGTLLQPQDIGILAALRIEKARILRKLRIAVLSTGDELVELGEEVQPGKIIDVNRHTLMAAVRELGCEAVDLSIARDNLDDIRSGLTEGIRLADLILVSGGISVGAKDLVPEVVNNLGKTGIIVHGVSIRPGMPTALAAIGNKPLILSPGSPVAALIAFRVFVEPIVAKMLGISPGYVKGQTIEAKMARKVASPVGLRTFLRVMVRKVDDGYVAEPIRTSGSSIISSLVRANGIVQIPERKEGVEKDESVEVELLRPVPR